MRTWRLALTGGEVCGAAGCKIPEGQPLQIIALRGLPSRVRCQKHAVGEPDWAQIERDSITQESTPVPAASARPSSRVKPHRPPTAFAKLSDAAGAVFDPKMAAAGRDD